MKGKVLRKTLKLKADKIQEIKMQNKKDYCLLF
mgnify:CR=1 FL=1